MIQPTLHTQSAARYSLMENTLAQFLDNLNRPLLHQLARAHNLPTPAKKSQLVEALKTHLSDPQVIANTLATLPPLTQKIFERLQLKGGRSSTMALLSELEQSGVLRPQPRGWQALKPGAAREPLSESFDQLLWPLVQFGLVFYRSFLVIAPETLTHYDVPLFIPTDILQALSGAHEPLRSIAPEQLERTHEGNPQTFQRDLYLYWNYMREHEVLLNATGLLPKRHLVKLNETLTHKEDVMTARAEADLPRLAFMRTLMEEAGLLKTNSALRLEPTHTSSDFFGYSLARRTDRLFETYKKSQLWNELLYLSITPQMNTARTTRGFTLITRARQWVLNLLGERLNEQWMSLDELAHKARVTNYEFLFPRERKDFGAINPYYYYHNPLGWGFPVTNEAEGWDKVEGSFIRSIISAPLHWLGLVSLGYEKDKATAFRLTALGAYVFGQTSQPPADELSLSSGRLVVQPNFQIFALEPMAEQTLATLDRFADRIKADRVFEYHLTRDSVYRASQNGMSVQAIIAFLSQAATTPLPQNVQRTLTEWALSFERIILRKHVSLLHTRDAPLLDELFTTADTGHLFQSRPLPYVAIARNSPDAREQIMQALLARGQLPAVTHPPQQAQPSDEALHALRLDEDGRVSLLHTLPNIFLLQALEQHVERRADGLYLTEAVVKADRANGESVEQIIARWERWHHGPMPAKLLTQIKRWGQFYGSAQVQQLTLIKMPSEELLQQVMSEPQIGAYLSPFAGDAATAIVAAGKLEAVQQWLSERGVPIA